ncbi:MAG: hypothetical protein ACREJO_16730 [Phycisphaerales bacterium]
MRRVAIAAIVSACALGVAAIIAAGPLNAPAGPVGPTYKTLGEIEPRIAINTLAGTGGPTWSYAISQPGSYYLTANLTGEPGKHVLRVGASNVTIDLNGFAIDGSAGAIRGIDGNTLEPNNVTVRNGTIRNCTDTAISSDATVSGWRIEGVRVSSCGSGIFAARHSVVRDCSVMFCSGTGISAIWGATVETSVSDENFVGFSVSFGSTIKGCSAQYNDSYGFNIGAGSTVTACTARDNADCGFNLADGASIRGSSASENTTDGIRLGDACVAESNTCVGNGPTVGVAGAGIRAVGDRCRVEGNALTGNYYAVRADGLNGFFAKNTASGNAFLLQYSISGTNTWGPIVGGTGASSNTNPWANFTH